MNPRTLQNSYALVQLAFVTADLVRGNYLDLAAEAFLLGSKNGTRTLFDDAPADIYESTLRKLLDITGFDSVLKVSKERAAKLKRAPPAFESQFPGNINPVRHTAG